MQPESGTEKITCLISLRNKTILWKETLVFLILVVKNNVAFETILRLLFTTLYRQVYMLEIISNSNETGIR